jgi:hypothetical protein
MGEQGHGEQISQTAEMRCAGCSLHRCRTSGSCRTKFSDRPDRGDRAWIKNLTGELQHLKNELGEAKHQLKQSRDEAQRSKEEARQSREAADQARQDAVRAPTAESQAAQAAAQAQAAAATPPAAVAASEGVTVSMPRGRPTIATADGRRSLALGGLMQFDMGGYFQNVNPNTEFPHLNNGVNLRRGRLYFLGTFDDFTANITPDFGDRPDGVVSLFEANDNYIGIKPLTRSPSDITILGSRWTTRQIPPMSCFSSARASSTSIEGWRQV